MGVPFLTVALADNQRPIAAELAGAGVSRDLGWHEQVGGVAPGRVGARASRRRGGARRDEPARPGDGRWIRRRTRGGDSVRGRGLNCGSSTSATIAWDGERRRGPVRAGRGDRRRRGPSPLTRALRGGDHRRGGSGSRLRLRRLYAAATRRSIASPGAPRGAGRLRLVRLPLPKTLLDAFPAGCINLHTGYLPYNRGAYPNVWCIVEGTPAGVRLHYLDEGVDTGAIVARREVAVEPVDTGRSLFEKLEEAALRLFQETWPAIASGAAPRAAQNPSEGTHRVADVARIDEIDLDPHVPGGRAARPPARADVRSPWGSLLPRRRTACLRERGPAVRRAERCRERGAAGMSETPGVAGGTARLRVVGPDRGPAGGGPELRRSRLRAELRRDPGVRRGLPDGRRRRPNDDRRLARGARPDGDAPLRPPTRSRCVGARSTIPPRLPPSPACGARFSRSWRRSVGCRARPAPHRPHLRGVGDRASRGRDPREPRELLPRSGQRA